VIASVAAAAAWSGAPLRAAFTPGGSATYIERVAAAPGSAGVGMAQNPEVLSTGVLNTGILVVFWAGLELGRRPMAAFIDMTLGGVARR
jgi:hypothetical protein